MPLKRKGEKNPKLSDKQRENILLRKKVVYQEFQQRKTNADLGRLRRESLFILTGEYKDDKKNTYLETSETQEFAAHCWKGNLQLTKNYPRYALQADISDI